MIAVLIHLIIILIVIGLLIYAASLLSGVGLPPPIVVAIQICIILIGVLMILSLIWPGLGHIRLP
jgi:hypothetical protein